jgi:ABC-type glycerol-3-phosphate transport system permease component
MVNMSLQTGDRILSYPPKFVPSLEGAKSYLQVFEETKLFTWIVNSSLVVLTITAISMSTGIFAGYSLSRYNFRGKGSGSFFILFSQMLPGALLVVPLYLIFMHMGMLDTFTSVILSLSAFTAPVATWFLKGYFDSIPVELEEAAMIDGCTRIQALRKIVLPVSLPALMSTAAWVFIIGWDEFLFAFTFLDSEAKWMLPIGLASFMGQYYTPWEQMMAAATITSIPVVCLFLVIQRYILRGLTAGSVKG